MGKVMFSQASVHSHIHTIPRSGWGSGEGYPHPRSGQGDYPGGITHYPISRMGYPPPIQVPGQDGGGGITQGTRLVSRMGLPPSAGWGGGVPHPGPMSGWGVPHQQDRVPPSPPPPSQQDGVPPPPPSSVRSFCNSVQELGRQVTLLGGTLKLTWMRLAGWHF